MKKQEIIALGVVIAVGMAQTAFAESDGLPTASLTAGICPAWRWAMATIRWA